MLGLDQEFEGGDPERRQVVVMMRIAEDVHDQRLHQGHLGLFLQAFFGEDLADEGRKLRPNRGW